MSSEDEDSPREKRKRVEYSDDEEDRRSYGCRSPTSSHASNDERDYRESHRRDYGEDSDRERSPSPVPMQLEDDDEDEETPAVGTPVDHSLAEKEFQDKIMEQLRILNEQKVQQNKSVMAKLTDTTLSRIQKLLEERKAQGLMAKQHRQWFEANGKITLSNASHLSALLKPAPYNSIKESNVQQLPTVNLTGLATSMPQASSLSAVSTPAFAGAMPSTSNSVLPMSTGVSTYMTGGTAMHPSIQTMPMSLPPTSSMAMPAYSTYGGVTYGSTAVTGAMPAGMMMTTTTAMQPQQMMMTPGMMPPAGPATVSHPPPSMAAVLPPPQVVLPVLASQPPGTQLPPQQPQMMMPQMMPGVPGGYMPQMAAPVPQQPPGMMYAQPGMMMPMMQQPQPVMVPQPQPVRQHIGPVPHGLPAGTPVYQPKPHTYLSNEMQYAPGEKPLLKVNLMLQKSAAAAQIAEDAIISAAPVLYKNGLPPTSTAESAPSTSADQKKEEEEPKNHSSVEATTTAKSPSGLPIVDYECTTPEPEKEENGQASSTVVEATTTSAPLPNSLVCGPEALQQPPPDGLVPGPAQMLPDPTPVPLPEPELPVEFPKLPYFKLVNRAAMMMKSSLSIRSIQLAGEMRFKVYVRVEHVPVALLSTTEVSDSEISARKTACRALAYQMFNLRLFPPATPLILTEKHATPEELLNAIKPVLSFLQFQMGEAKYQKMLTEDRSIGVKEDCPAHHHHMAAALAHTVREFARRFWREPFNNPWLSLAPDEPDVPEPAPGGAASGADSTVVFPLAENPFSESLVMDTSKPPPPVKLTITDVPEPIVPLGELYPVVDEEGNPFDSTNFKSPFVQTVSTVVIQPDDGKFPIEIKVPMHSNIGQVVEGTIQGLRFTERTNTTMGKKTTVYLSVEEIPTAFLGAKTTCQKLSEAVSKASHELMQQFAAWGLFPVDLIKQMCRLPDTISIAMASLAPLLNAVADIATEPQYSDLNRATLEFYPPKEAPPQQQAVAREFRERVRTLCDLFWDQKPMIVMPSNLDLPEVLEGEHTYFMHKIGFDMTKKVEEDLARVSNTVLHKSEMEVPWGTDEGGDEYDE